MKKITFLLLLFISALSINAQITIGGGTSEKYVPIDPYFGYSYSQNIYLQSEIPVSGNITELSFQFNGNSTISNSRDWVVYIGHTTKTEFTSTTDWIPVANMTEVFNGTIPAPAGAGTAEWITIDITDFAYNGTDNLVVAVNEIGSGYDGNADFFYATATTANRSIYERTDSAVHDPAAPPTADAIQSYVSNIIFGGLTVSNPPNCDAVITTTVNAPLDSMSWSAATGAPTGYKLTVGTTSGGTDIVNNEDVGNVTSYTFATPLSDGTTYYATITPYNAAGDATGCSEQTFTTFVTPANDDCSGAISIPVNTDATCTNVVSGTIEWATDSGVSDNGSGTPNDDVWFSFVATADTHVIKMLNKAGSYQDLVHEVLSGDCNNLVSVNVSDPDTSTVSGLTIGDTYYIRVYGYSSTAGRDTTFDVCVSTLPSPPANDDCAGAISVPVNTDATCTNVVSGTIAGATDSGVSDNGSGTPNDDVWFSFVATADTHIIKMLNKVGSYTDLVHEVLSGDCNNLVSVNVSDPDTSTVSGLTIGDTYYIRVYGYSSTAGRDTTFDVCVSTLPSPPANDDCAGAIAITPQSGVADAASAAQTAGSIAGATDSGIAAGSCNGTPNDDVWYSFVADAADYNITLMDTFDGVVELYSGDCNNLVYMDCHDFGTNPEISATGLTVGDTYYIRVFAYSSLTQTNTDFTLAVWRTYVANVNDLQSVGFAYYPNPVNDTLTMKANENISEVSVFNMLGQQVKTVAPSALQANIDMSNLSSGAYFVKAQVGDAVGTFKIIKN